MLLLWRQIDFAAMPYLVLRQRQINIERRARADLAANAELPAVPHHDDARNGQPKPVTAAFGFAGTVTAVEAFEYSRKLFLGDARPVVAHGQRAAVLGFQYAEGNGAALGGSTLPRCRTGCA